MSYSVHPPVSEYGTAGDPGHLVVSDGRDRAVETHVCVICISNTPDIIVSVKWKGILYENVHLCAPCFIQVWRHKEATAE
jgi:hypothetical protein